MSGLSERIRSLAPADRAGVAPLGGVLMTADAQLFAFTYSRVSAALFVVDGLQ